MRRCVGRASPPPPARTACGRWRRLWRCGTPRPAAVRSRSGWEAEPMARPKVLSATDAAALVPDGATLTVSSSSGLGCPDAVLAAIGERFAGSGHPRNLTSIHPIAAGDMYGIRGVDHLAQEGLLARVLAGSYPSGPSSMPSPVIWEMITHDRISAYNVPSGILFDLTREAAAKRPGVLTKVGLDTFVDPDLQGCAMNARAAAEPI